MESQSETYSLQLQIQMIYPDSSFSVHKAAHCTSKEESEPATLILHVQGVSLADVYSKRSTTHNFGAAAVLALIQHDWQKSQ